MSTLCCDTAADTALRDEINFPCLHQNHNFFSAVDNFCIGQDAQYILKKRALILDLWNLIPEKQPETPPYACCNPPVLYSNHSESFEFMPEKSIPLQ